MQRQRNHRKLPHHHHKARTRSLRPFGTDSRDPARRQHRHNLSLHTLTHRVRNRRTAAKLDASSHPKTTPLREATTNPDSDMRHGPARHLPHLGPRRRHRPRRLAISMVLHKRTTEAQAPTEPAAGAEVGRHARGAAASHTRRQRYKLVEKGEIRRIAELLYIAAAGIAPRYWSAHE